MIVTHRKRLAAFRGAIFSHDHFDFKPVTADTKFSTKFSVASTYVIFLVWLFTVGYTGYVWMVTPLEVMVGESPHNQGFSLLSIVPPGNDQALKVPQAAVVIRLGDGSVLTGPSLIKWTYRQNTICNVNNTQKYSDDILTAPCTFTSGNGTHMPIHVQDCIDWDGSHAMLMAMNATNSSTTAVNPCRNSDSPYIVPRVSGTFNGGDFSYITALAAINYTYFNTNRARLKNLFTGTVTVMLEYPFTQQSSLTRGAFPNQISYLYQRSRDLIPNTTIKWESIIRFRMLSDESYYMKITALDASAIDYYVKYSEPSHQYFDAAGAQPWMEVAKIYLKIDERDDEVNLDPYSNLIDIIGTWGGFLEILALLGVPAACFNRWRWKRTVQKLITQNRIVFDENRRMRRQHRLAEVFASGEAPSSRAAVMLRSHAFRRGPLAPIHTALTRAAGSMRSSFRRHGSSAGSTSGSFRWGGGSFHWGGGSFRGGGDAAPAHLQADQQDGHSTSTPPAGMMVVLGTASNSNSSSSSSSCQGNELDASGGAHLHNLHHQLEGHTDLPEAAAAQHAGQNIHSSSATAVSSNTTAAAPTAAANVLGNRPGSAMALRQAAAPPSQVASTAPHAGKMSRMVSFHRSVSGEDAAAATTAATAMAVAAGEPGGKGSASGVGAPVFQSPDVKTVQLQQSGPAGVGFRKGGERRALPFLPRFDSLASMSGSASGSAYSGGDACEESSLKVDYRADVFEPNDKDLGTYEDVIRHVQSECSALYHMKQLTALVTEEAAFFTLMPRRQLPASGQQGAT